MAVRRAVAISVGVCAALTLSVSVVAIAFGGGRQVATEGDPYVVTPGVLKSELGKVGLKVRYLRAVPRPAPVVAGVAHFHRELLGFEVQLFPTSDEATARYLGRLRARDFGWPEKIYHGLNFSVTVRGVLGNVAFAEYERSPLQKHYTLAEARQAQLTFQHLRRALDDALFASFPEDDPYVHALSVAPP